MQLSEGKVRYSPGEKAAFAVIPKSGVPITTNDIVDKLYGRKKRPHYARQTVLGTMVSLSRKIKANKEPFKLDRTERRGPHPVEFMLVP